MCRHQPAPLYAEPTPHHPATLHIAYVLRGHDGWVRCVKCDLTGFYRAGGKGVRWLTKGTVGYLLREKKLAHARAWNELVRAALPVEPAAEPEPSETP